MAATILTDGPGRDVPVMIVENEKELEFLITYRQADDAGKRRITKILNAAYDGLLPSLEQIGAWSKSDRDAFVDSLPEVQL